MTVALSSTSSIYSQLPNQCRISQQFYLVSVPSLWQSSCLDINSWILMSFNQLLFVSSISNSITNKSQLVQTTMPPGKDSVFSSLKLPIYVFILLPFLVSSLISVESPSNSTLSLGHLSDSHPVWILTTEANGSSWALISCFLCHQSAFTSQILFGYFTRNTSKRQLKFTLRDYSACKNPQHYMPGDFTQLHSHFITW